MVFLWFKTVKVRRPIRATAISYHKFLSGQLITLGGQTVMGYPAVNGAVSPNSGLEPINVGAGTTTRASATSNFSLTTNLDASTAVGGDVSVTDRCVRFPG